MFLSVPVPILHRSPPIKTLYEADHDRFCHAATDALPSTMPGIQKIVQMPINDMGWAKGDIETRESSLVLSSLTSNHDSIGRFATTCQAAHLFSHVLEHRLSSKNREPSLTETLQLDEALQLNRTLLALDGRLSLDDAAEANIEALSLVSTARMVIYNMYGCNEPDIRSSAERLKREVEMQRASIQGVMDLAANRIPQMAQTIIDILASASHSSRGRNISPVVAHCLYHAATECGWFIREGCGPEMTTGLAVIVSAIDQLKTSWAVSGESVAEATILVEDSAD